MKNGIATYGDPEFLIFEVNTNFHTVKIILPQRNKAVRLERVGGAADFEVEV